VWVGVELSGAYYTASTRLLGRQEQFSGLALLPSFTVMSRF